MTSELLEKDIVPAAGDDVGQFLNEIRHFPRLSPEEERQLAGRCAAGDEEAIRQMVNSNLRLVVSVAKEYAGLGVPLLDLIQEGSIGLLSAARKFDHTLDFKFSTYATKWIRQGITRCLSSHSQLIRVPEHTAERIRRVRQARHSLMQRWGREPDIAMVAKECNMPESKVTQLLLLAPETCSLDAPAGEDREGTLGVLLEDIHTLQPQQTLVRQELEQTLDRLLSCLDQRQKQVLRLHFGMEDGVDHSLEEIGVMLGISKERVRQIEKQAFAKLQKLGEGLGLEDFLNE